MRATAATPILTTDCYYTLSYVARQPIGYQQADTGTVRLGPAHHPCRVVRAAIRRLANRPRSHGRDQLPCIQHSVRSMRGIRSDPGLICVLDDGGH
jgi:hypothetical protein